MEHFNHVFAAVGPLEAVCHCEPPGARGGSGLPWYHTILNLLGIVKVTRAEAEVFLGLAQVESRVASKPPPSHRQSPFAAVARGRAHVAQPTSTRRPSFSELSVYTPDGASGSGPVKSPSAHGSALEQSLDADGTTASLRS